MVAEKYDFAFVSGNRREDVAGESQRGFGTRHFPTGPELAQRLCEIFRLRLLQIPAIDDKNTSFAHTLRKR